MDPDSSRVPPPRLRRHGASGRSGSARLRVTVTDGQGRPVLDEGLARWLAAVAPVRLRAEVAIALVPDSRIRALNQRYRRKHAATDVLSFPAAPEPRASRRQVQHRSRAVEPFLGDIVIATGIARRQARQRRHAYRTELRVLALHGLLHLLGHDHEDDRDGGRMARLEATLWRKGGLPAGLIDRAAAARPRGPR